MEKYIVQQIDTRWEKDRIGAKEAQTEDQAKALADQWCKRIDELGLKYSVNHWIAFGTWDMTTIIIKPA